MIMSFLCFFQSCFFCLAAFAFGVFNNSKGLGANFSFAVFPWGRSLPEKVMWRVPPTLLYICLPVLSGFWMSKDDKPKVTCGITMFFQHLGAQGCTEFPHLFCWAGFFMGQVVFARKHPQKAPRQKKVIAFCSLCNFFPSETNGPFLKSSILLGCPWRLVTS